MSRTFRLAVMTSAPQIVIALSACIGVSPTSDQHRHLHVLIEAGRAGKRIVGAAHDLATRLHPALDELALTDGTPR